MINTSQGNLPVFDAVQFAKANPAHADVRGILIQLMNHGKAQWQARYVSKYILANASFYNKNVVNLAQEFVTGVPVGTKMYPDVQKLYDALSRAMRMANGLRLKVVLTRVLPPQNVAAQILALETKRMLNLLNASDRMVLLAVQQSNDWDQPRNRTCMFDTHANLSNMDSSVSLREFAQLLFPVIESFEVVQVYEHRLVKIRQEIANSVRKRLLGDENIWFDLDVFKSVATPAQMECLRYLPEDKVPTLVDIFDLLDSEESQKFIDDYRKKFLVAAGGS